MRGVELEHEAQALARALGVVHAMAEHPRGVDEAADLILRRGRELGRAHQLVAAGDRAILEQMHARDALVCGRARQIERERLLEREARRWHVARVELRGAEALK